ncbi:MAG TPA: hypothetical protein VK760_06140 [Candidatus Acidoferrales bacterium]|nr:hypothetical protein [Candidatus Acidoferrales bacterium]
MEGSTRRRLSGILAACAAVASIAAVAQAAKEPRQEGVFALFGGTQSTTAEYRVDPANGGGIRTRVRLFEVNSKAPVVAFGISSGRSMQMTIVRDDFATFQHVNPSVDATTGTFHETLTNLDPAHRYYMYADTVPERGTEQVFRFNVQDEHIPAVPPASTLAASAKSFAIGAYNVQLGDTTITANKPSTLLIGVHEHGKMAWDLEAYMGGPGYATMINASTLQFVHLSLYKRGSSNEQAIHDAVSGTPQTGPYINAQLPALPAGSYKLWVQIRGSGDKVMTAPFTIVAQ